MEWQKNPVLAARDILNVKLDPHQRIVLETYWNCDSVIGVLSRGTGKTFCGAVFACLRAMLKPSHRVGLIGPSFRQSKMLFAEIEKLYEKSPMFQESVKGYPVKSADSCEIKFKAASGMNGSFIQALPLGVDGAKIRGARFYTVVADEGAQIDDHTLDTVVRGFMATTDDPVGNADRIEEMERLIAQGLARPEDLVMPESNKLILSSTAFYQYNHLWRRTSKMINDLKEQYRVAKVNGEDLRRFKFAGGGLNNNQIPHRLMTNGSLGLVAFTYQDPRKGFMSMKSIEEAKRDMAGYMFDMEYNCLFPNDSAGYYPRSILDKCRLHGEFACIDEPRKGMIYVMGIDPARTHDNFAISIWEVDMNAGCCNLVRVYSYNKKSFPLMHQQVRAIRRKFNIEYFEMDGGGGGTTIRDLLADKASCPPGEELILEQEFDEHRGLQGRRLLGPLINFASYEWVHDANTQLLSGLEHGRVKIAGKPGAGGLWTPIQEEWDKEMEEALVEWSSIVTEPAGDRLKWTTPTDAMRKDRYSAILVGYSAARKVLARAGKPKSLPFGGWA